MFRLCARRSGALSALILLSACAPSLRMLHRSNEVFEHCYATDLQADQETPAKAACWSDWIDNFTEGQSPDRIAYAQRRRESLAHNEASPSLDPVAEPASDATAVDASSDRDAALDAGTPAAVQTSAPRPFEAPRGNVACGATCDPAYQRCAARCSNEHPGPCRTACDTEFRTCREGCY